MEVGLTEDTVYWFQQSTLTTESDQKFPKIVTFLQITVTSSIFNEFVQTLACLILRNVYYIV